MGYRIDWGCEMWGPTDTYAEALGIVLEMYPSTKFVDADDVEDAGDAADA
jgi:hypothetical protein